MQWWIKDYRKIEKKYPNIYRNVEKHGNYFQAQSDYGDLSYMFKTKEEALKWAKNRNKTKTFNVKDYKW